MSQPAGSSLHDVSLLTLFFLLNYKSMYCQKKKTVGDKNNTYILNPSLMPFSHPFTGPPNRAVTQHIIPVWLLLFLELTANLEDGRSPKQTTEITEGDNAQAP